MIRTSSPPAVPGFYWAKWRVAADETTEADGTTPSDRWEPVEVFESRIGTDIAAYIEALKRFAKVDADEGLADAIGVTRLALADWRKRGRVPAEVAAQMSKRFGRQLCLSNFDRSPGGSAGRFYGRGANTVLRAFVPGVATPQSLDSFVWGNAVR